MITKAVIFDWDGTLADTRKAVVQSFQRVLKESGCNVSDEFIERRIGIGTKKTIIEAFRKCNVKIDVLKLENLAKKKIMIQVELADTVNLFDGAIELLEVLKGKTKVGLATMTNRKVIDVFLSKKNIESFFEVAISADEVDNPKPNPEAFLIVANRMGVNPKDCVVIEDSVFGVRAAKAAKMKCIAVSTGVYNKKELTKENPDMLVGSLAEKDKILSFILS